MIAQLEKKQRAFKNNNRIITAEKNRPVQLVGMQKLDGLVHPVDGQQVCCRLQVLLLQAQLPHEGLHCTAPHPETSCRRRQAALEGKTQEASRAINNQHSQQHRTARAAEHSAWFMHHLFVNEEERVSCHFRKSLK